MGTGTTVPFSRVNGRGAVRAGSNRSRHVPAKYTVFPRTIMRSSLGVPSRTRGIMLRVARAPQAFTESYMSDGVASDCTGAPKNTRASLTKPVSGTLGRRTQIPLAICTVTLPLSSCGSRVMRSR
jgi:hypothetical protein